MSKHYRNTILAAVCTLALVLAVAAGVDAQSNKPINDDDIIACIEIGSDVWVAPVALQPELEQHLQQSATVEPMGLLVQRLPVAVPGFVIRFEGAVPSTGVSNDLDALGYTQAQPASPELPSAQVAVLRTF